MPPKVVIIGGVALGPKAACRIKRLLPEAEVTMIDSSALVSYGGCGIPFYVSGDVPELKELYSTSFHFERDPEFFRKAKGVKVMTRTLAERIDREGKIVYARNLETGEALELPYDKLVIGTGSTPVRPPIEGMDLPGVFTVSNLEDARSIKEMLARGQVDSAVVIGAGAIGVEMAQAVTDLWGVDVAVVEIMDQVLPGLIDRDLAHMVEKELADNGVELLLKSKASSIVAGEDGRAAGVVVEGREIPADLVICAVGVRPNSALAEEAGLKIGETGGIVVNEHLETSDADIYAGGDCVEMKDLITGKKTYLPSGSLANRQGRVIGTNAAGGRETFPGVVGSFAMKVFELAVVKTGLTCERAEKEGFDAASVLVVQADRAHFYPENKLMYLRLTADGKTGKLLGAAGVGENGDALAGRIDSVAAMLPYGATVDDLSNLELAYAPPFSAAMDVLNAAANTLKNTLEGRHRALEVHDFPGAWENQGERDVLFLDVRAWPNVKPFSEANPKRWLHFPQEELKTLIEKIPEAETYVLICNSGVRSYEAQITLEEAGIKNTFNLAGGIAAVKRAGFHPLETSEEEPD